MFLNQTMMLRKSFVFLIAFSMIILSAQQSNPTSTESTTLPVNSKVMPPPEYKFEKDKSAILDCSSLNVEVDFFQKKHETDNDIDKKIENSEKFVISENKLTIHNLTNDDFSYKYYCTEKSEQANESKKQFIFDAHPYAVLHDGEKIEHIKLENSFLKVVLNVKSGHSCTWFKENMLKNGTIIKEPITSNDNLELTRNMTRIPNITPESAGKYICSIKNGYGYYAQAITLKVIDQFVAFWTFLGIFIQVVICCIVVFIWEKKSLKKSKENQYNIDQNQSYYKHSIRS